MTLIITNQFVKFVRFVGNKKLCSSVILSFKNKTKSIINPAKCVYCDELKSGWLSLLATRY